MSKLKKKTSRNVTVYIKWVEKYYEMYLAFKISEVAI